MTPKLTVKVACGDETLTLTHQDLELVAKLRKLTRAELHKLFYACAAAQADVEAYASYSEDAARTVRAIMTSWAYPCGDGPAPTVRDGALAKLAEAPLAERIKGLDPGPVRTKIIYGLLYAALQANTGSRHLKPNILAAAFDATFATLEL